MRKPSSPPPASPAQQKRVAKEMSNLGAKPAPAPKPAPKGGKR